MIWAAIIGWMTAAGAALMAAGIALRLVAVTKTNGQLGSKLVELTGERDDLQGSLDRRIEMLAGLQKHVERIESQLTEAEDRLAEAAVPGSGAAAFDGLLQKAKGGDSPDGV